MPGRIVGVDEEDGPGAGVDPAFQLGKIDPPAEVIEERIGLEADVVQGGKKVEQRIAWLCNEDFVTRIAKKAKEKRVRFAGAGGEDESIAGNVGLVIRVVPRDRGPCGWDSSWVGMIKDRCGKRTEIVREAAGRWIREGEVQKRAISDANGPRERRFGEIPGGAGGKGHVASLGQRHREVTLDTS